MFWELLLCTEDFYVRAALCLWGKLGLCISGPVYTGPDEFLHGRIFYLDSLFTWDRANSVTDCSSVYMGPCKFSRLCHDWLKLLFSANHVAVDGLLQIQNGDLDKNFTWTDKDINLLLHVVLDYIKKSRRRR